jgi:hypothetical protein
MADADGKGGLELAQDTLAKVEVAADVTTPKLLRTPFSGHALVAEEGNLIAASEGARVVALMGPTKSGKTTLLLSIYEEFRHGRFADALFAGSRTLLGFEERCHLSRAASEGEDPDTERTKADAEEVLLHLRIRSKATAKTPTNLILCDLSGELFDDAGESTDALIKIPFIGRAAHVVMFVDGNGLSDLAKRHTIRQEFLTLFRASVESKQFTRLTRVDVVFSKQDCVAQSQERLSIEQFQDDIEAVCRARFENHVRSLRFFRIASRPKPNKQLVELFNSWLANDNEAIQPNLSDANSCVRQIDVFGCKERLSNLHSVERPK